LPDVQYAIICFEYHKTPVFCGRFAFGDILTVLLEFRPHFSYNRGMSSHFKMSAPTAPQMGFSFSVVARTLREGLISDRLLDRTRVAKSPMADLRKTWASLWALTPHLRFR